MKILVVSDTHGYNANLLKVIEKEKPFEMLVHCGDLSMDADDLMDIAGTPVYVCAGNNDYFYNLKQEEMFDIYDHRVLVVHGHRQGVYNGVHQLLYKAEESDADIVMFGHTHMPYIDEVEGITFINPGSLTYPRQENRRETYALLNISPDGTIETELKFL